MSLNVPIRYLPPHLSRKDKLKQMAMLKRSRKQYKTRQYYTRKPVSSFRSKTSKHVNRAKRIYGVSQITPNRALSRATGCSISALKKIVKKGEGAYFSSGSRPNQTAQSWGYARLASALTAGKSAAVDFSILEKGCNHRGKAFHLAKTAKKKYGYGQGKTRKIDMY
jgi:hypothetical protein